MHTVRTLSWFPLACVVVLASGCSDPDGRAEVSGTIKLAGQTLNDGLISFEPLEGQDTKSGAMIENGAFRIPRQKGLKPGKYLVRVTAGDGKTPTNPEEIGGPSKTNIVSKDRIPPEWSARSKQEVTICGTEPNNFDFDIPAK